MRVCALFLNLSKILIAENKSYLFTITVVDMFKHTQLFRADKLFDKILANECILVPGINLFCTLVLTISVKYDNSESTTYVAFQQFMVCLRDIANYIDPVSFELKFTRNIAWCPETIKVDDATIVEDENFILSYDVEYGLYFEKSFNAGCTFTIEMQNLFSTWVGLCVAPIVELLRRSFDKSENNKLVTRISCWWVCFYGLHLYFYNKYGNLSPSYICDIRDVSIVQSARSKFKSVKVVLQFQDGKRWKLDFQSNDDAKKFENAFAQSQKDRTKSLSHNSDITSYSSRDFSFSTAQL